MMEYVGQNQPKDETPLVEQEWCPVRQKPKQQPKRVVQVRLQVQMEIEVQAGPEPPAYHWNRQKEEAQVLEVAP